MKNLVLSLSILLAGFSAISQNNYSIKMSVRTEGLPPEYAAYGEQEIVTYVKGDYTKTEVSSMMFTSTVYSDGKTVTSLTDATGNKSAYKASKEEIEEAQKNNAKPKIEYTTEKKTIAGYECSKAIITGIGKDKKEKVTIAWITDKISANQTLARKANGRMNLGDLKGQPMALEMTMNQNGMDMKVLMTVTEVIIAPLEDSVFTINTEGFNVLTYKEILEQQKNMMQGR